jgi:hypothetical protein
MSQATNNHNLCLTERIARQALRIMFMVLLAVFLFLARDVMGGIEKLF